jgi:hypothetical protein
MSDTKTQTRKSLLDGFASKITAENSFIKASFGGFAGSGKTRTATEFIIGCYKLMKCDRPVLFIDNEKGSRFVKPIFEKAGIETYVKETVELADILQAFKLLNDGEISFLFMDSLTKVWYKYVRDYKENNHRKFMTLQDWGKILPAWQETFADKFVELTGNCIFTGRGGYTYDMEENDETKKKEFVKSGVKMKMAGETPFEPDLNIWMEVAQEIGEDDKPKIWREALVMKDRSGLIDGKTFINPSFKEFEPVVSFLINSEKGAVSKATDTTNLAPKEDYDEKRKQKEIYNDRIKSEFEKRQLGTGKEEKQVKAVMIEKCFGTVSSVEIENFKLERLMEGYNKLLDILTVYDQADGDKIKAIKDYQFKLI